MEIDEVIAKIKAIFFYFFYLKFVLVLRGVSALSVTFS